MTDLEIAIQRYQKVLDITSVNHSDRARRLQNFGRGYGNRYQKTDAMTDLEIAIQRYQEALDHSSSFIRDRLPSVMTDQDNASKIFVPENQRVQLIKEVHEQPAVGHPGVRRTLEMLKRFFEWPKMRQDVEQYIRNCHSCRRAKAPRDGYHGKLRPIPIEAKPWQDVSLDFVTGLPDSSGYNAILMVVDRFSKMHHYIPCVAGDEGTSAEETAKLLIRNVWKLHGLPKIMISDRGPQFVSLVWQTLCKILNIKSKLSTAFHPETDGQSEISNQEMERYLRTYVNYQQDDWSDWLPMAEYSSNASTSVSSTMSPFFVNYGFEPRMSFEPVGIEGTARERILKQKAKDIHVNMENI